MKTLQIISLVVLGIIIIEINYLVSGSNLENWQNLILPSSIAYTSFLSLYLLDDKMKIFKGAIAWVWKKLFGSRKVLRITFLVLTLSFVGLLIPVYGKVLDNRYNTIVSIYNQDKLLAEKGEKIILRNVLTKEELELRTEGEGFARTRINKPVSIQIIYDGFIYPPIKIEVGQIEIKINSDKARDIAKRLEQGEINEVDEQQLSTNYLSKAQDLIIPCNDGISNIHEYLLYGISNLESFSERNGYIVNYNPILKVPNCVAYSIYGDPLDIKRPTVFPKDISLNSANHKDYINSGFDRGHLVANADMRYKNPSAVRDAFLMSAITPQYPYFNRRVWVKVEQFARELEKTTNDTIYIYAGPLFISDDDSETISFNTIGESKVAVPTHFFRIISRDNGNSIEAYSFIIPNSNELTTDIESYLTSVNEIEKRSSIDFFSDLPIDVQESFESEVSELQD